ncbi:hypothetical protein [Bacillus glycinifermentans]|uniref:hypothetical protein n=1 Tax=Bacillus glycinifermentans TaxID=1664069 RepID=UPI001582296D|nr:hypothetical protein [Bacillus glycinifermentans]
MYSRNCNIPESSGASFIDGNNMFNTLLLEKNGQFPACEYFRSCFFGKPYGILGMIPMRMVKTM